MIECLLSTLIDCVFTSKRACEVLDSLFPGLEESLAAVFYEQAILHKFLRNSALNLQLTCNFGQV